MEPIRCDYCDALAVMFHPRRGPEERSFACAQHLERAAGAVGSLPISARTDAALPGRPRFAELDLVAMLARWRNHRAQLAAA